MANERHHAPSGLNGAILGVCRMGWSLWSRSCSCCPALSRTAVIRMDSHRCIGPPLKVRPLPRLSTSRGCPSLFDPVYCCVLIIRSSVAVNAAPYPSSFALWSGSEAIVGHLLAAGADVNAVTNDSWTALHEASLNGHTAVVARLLQAGAQVSSVTCSCCSLPFGNPSPDQLPASFQNIDNAQEKRFSSCQQG